MAVNILPAGKVTPQTLAGAQILTPDVKRIDVRSCAAGASLVLKWAGGVSTTLLIQPGDSIVAAPVSIEAASTSGTVLWLYSASA